MTMLTELARVARDAGLTVIEESGWKTRGYTYRGVRYEMGKINGVACHHTAGSDSRAVVRNGRPGVPGPLSHILLRRDGTVVIISAGLANHAGKVRRAEWSNSHMIGIEAENLGTGQNWPDVQIDAFVRLCAALIDEFDLDVADVLGHKEICAPVGRKTDPYFKNPAMTMDQFRGFVKQGYYLKSGKPSASKPAPSKPSTSKPSTSKPAATKNQSAKNPPNGTSKFPSNYDDLLLDKDMGRLTVGALQILLRNVLKSRKVAQYNLLWDGDFGPRFTKDVQNWMRGNGYYKVAKVAHGGVKKGTALGVDGNKGFYFWYELQRFLAAKGFYKKTPSGAALKVDGKPGAWTYWALQRYLNSQNG